MWERIKQRDDIENFIEFVGSFLVTEDATINEINLVESNLDILKERIAAVKEMDIKAVVNQQEEESNFEKILAEGKCEGLGPLGGNKLSEGKTILEKLAEWDETPEGKEALKQIGDMIKGYGG